MKKLIIVAAIAACSTPAIAGPPIIYSDGTAPLDLRCSKPYTMHNGRCVRRISAEPEERHTIDELSIEEIEELAREPAPARARPHFRRPV